jgi:hypothetical protein
MTCLKVLKVDAANCAEKRQGRLIKRLGESNYKVHTRIYLMTCRKVLKAPSGDFHVPLANMRSGRPINVSEKASKRDMPDDLPKSAQSAHQ